MDFRFDISTPSDFDLALSLLYLQFFLNYRHDFFCIMIHALDKKNYTINTRHFNVNTIKNMIKNEVVYNEKYIFIINNLKHICDAMVSVYISRVCIQLNALKSLLVL